MFAFANREHSKEMWAIGFIFNPKLGKVSGREKKKRDKEKKRKREKEKKRKREKEKKGKDHR